MKTPWGTEETVEERMSRQLCDAHAEAENRNLGAAAMNAAAALDAWREAGSPDGPVPSEPGEGKP